MSSCREPHLFESLLPIVFLSLFLLVGEYILKIEPHIPLFFGCVVAAIVAINVGYSWREVKKSILESIYRALEAIIIILIVGMLIGIWILAGTIPAMVYYGLDFIKPQFFLLTGCLLCAMISFATGSSWTSGGTVGVALMGISTGLSINAAVTAGMVISGAYFGDKLSPFSDSSNIAAATAETSLYAHVASMMYTTIPSFIIALLIYTVMGFGGISGEIDYAKVQLIQQTIKSDFIITPWAFVPALVILLLAVNKVPPIPSLFAGVFTGGVWSVLLQGKTITEVLVTLQFGYHSNYGIEIVDNLFSRGGFDSMMWTISLIIFALAFGGITERAGFSRVLLNKVIGGTKSVTELIAKTIAMCIASDYILTDQYLSIIVPGRAFASTYDKMGLDRKVLSRTLEDGATLWSPLCPWNGCGAYQAATLGVATFSYLPFAFFNIINPFVAIVMAYFGWGIFHNKNVLQEIIEREGYDI